MGADLRNPAIDKVILSSFFADFGKLIQKAVTAPRPDYQFDKNQLNQFFSDFSRFYKDRLRSGMMIDPWAIAGLGRDEVRNSAVLAWLFDENGSHGMEGAFLQAFLTHCQRTDKSPLILNKAVRNYHVYTEKYSLGDRRNRIDLVIEGEEFVLFIEVKIDAAEGTEQVQSYCKILKERAALTANKHNGSEDPKIAIKQHALIYLTPHGGMPNIAEYDSKLVRPAKWNDISSTLRKLLLQEKNENSSSIINFLLEKLATYFSKF